MTTATLPAPAIVEALDFEDVFARLRDDAVQAFSDAGVNYDVGNLETDPVVIVLQAAAASEVRLRARINEAARAQLLVYASGTDLDHLASFYGVTRVVDETDAQLKERVYLAIAGRSPAGGRSWYEARAREADPRVKAALARRLDSSPTITIAVQHVDPDADAAELEGLRSTVEAFLERSDVRVLSDKISVVVVSERLENIVANVYLVDGEAETAFSTLEDDLRSAWEKEGSLGRDLTVSWIIAQLQKSGIYRVEVLQPVSDVVVKSAESIKLAQVQVNLVGYGF
jgi:phage-related baseplate assembly protein